MQIPRTMNTIGYVIFVALAAFSAFSHHDYMTAGSQLGLGLIFDPFGLPGYGWFLE